MSLIPYALARPFLFGMDAEAAHELTMDMLARGQRTPLQWAWCNEPVDDPIELAGLTFPNRVGLAAGLRAVLWERFFDLNGLIACLLLAAAATGQAAGFGRDMTAQTPRK